MTEPFHLQSFADWDALVETAVGLLASALTDAALARGRATAALSGGSTPGDIYRRLSLEPLPWRRLTFTLTDERWVEPSSPDSNARLVRDTLLRGRAALAHLLPLKAEAAQTPEEAATRASEALMPRLPLDAVLLGMGADGHIASLFPGNSALTLGLAPDAPVCFAAPAGGPAPPQPRLSLSLPPLLSARLLLLVIRGKDKLDLLHRASVSEALSALPVSVLMARASTPLRVLWAP